jgi:hypothetical protein
MPFTTDGRVHHSGILNEKNVCAFLNGTSSLIRAAICPVGSTVEHRGGTSTKMDGEIVCSTGNKSISIKHHKTGTFDWLNSTSAVPSALKGTLNSELATIRSIFASSAKDDAAKELARKQCDALFCEHLRTMPSDTIRGILSSCYSAYTDYIVITDVSNNSLIAFAKEENMPELKTYEGWTYVLKSTARAKTSAQIWRTLNGQEVNTRLRMRLVLNNGVSALLGLSASNSSSVPCIKIQQDKVAGFLASLVNPVKEKYEVQEALQELA